MDLKNFFILLGLYGLPVLLAITLHEAAHGFVALRLGDPTAKEQGRLTLNPFNHVDPFGTLLLPGLLIFMQAPFLFGYAKPVPVTFHRLYHPKRDMMLVAAAGPATNILLAVVSAFIIRLIVTGDNPIHEGSALSYVTQSLIYSIHMNVTLAVFNMLPIPPLDGGRVLTGLLPSPYDQTFGKIEKYGFIIVFFLFFLAPAYLGKVHPLFTVCHTFLIEAIAWVKQQGILPLLGFEVTSF